MTNALSPPRHDTMPATTGSRGVHVLPMLILGGWAAQAAVRLLMWSGRNRPMVLPDEAGYLLGARWLTGGPVADFSGFTFYQGGYSLLLTPAYLVSDDPATVYQIVRWINAGLSGLLFPLGFLLLRRLGVRRLHAYVLAWAAALLPAYILYSGLALADTILPVLLLGWLLALDRFVRDASLPAAVVASLLASYACAVHMRGMIMLAVHVAVLAAYLLWRRAPARTRWAAAAGLGVSFAVYLAGTLLNSRLLDALYPTGQRDLTGILQDRVTTLDGQLWAISGAVGQIWAMVCATWGLAGVGLILVARTALTRGDARDRILGGVLLATTAGVAYAASAALPNELRIGNFAYSRYLSFVAVAYALVGLTGLVRAKRARHLYAGTIGMMAFTGLWVRLYGGERLSYYDFYLWDLPEVGLLGGSYDYFRPAVTSLAVAVLLAAFWALNRWGTPKLFGMLVVVNLCAVLIPIVILRNVDESSPPVPLPAAIRGAPVAMERPRPGTDERRPDPYKPTPEMLYLWLAFHIDWTRLKGFDRDGTVPADVCSAIVYWPTGVVAKDSWRTPPEGWRYQRNGIRGRGYWWVVWYDPSCRS